MNEVFIPDDSENSISLLCVTLNSPILIIDTRNNTLLRVHLETKETSYSFELRLLFETLNETSRKTWEISLDGSDIDIENEFREFLAECIAQGYRVRAYDTVKEMTQDVLDFLQEKLS